MIVGGWIQRTKAIRKDAVKMVEATVQLRGDITKESEEMQIEALKEARGLKEMYGRKNIISRSDPARQRYLCDLCR